MQICKNFLARYFPELWRHIIIIMVHCDIMAMWDKVIQHGLLTRAKSNSHVGN